MSFQVADSSSQFFSLFRAEHNKFLPISGQHVHKHFGGSKRVAEVDKKIIQTLIATRYQAAKEAWRRQLESERGAKEKALG